jgi:hypothetical protein
VNKKEHICRRSDSLNGGTISRASQTKHRWLANGIKSTEERGVVRRSNLVPGWDLHPLLTGAFNSALQMFLRQVGINALSIPSPHQVAS